MKAYIVNFNPLSLMRNEVIAFFDSRPEILNWYIPFDGTIIVVSNNTATQLTELMATRFLMQFFLISEPFALNINGRLPGFGWDFINNPKSSGRWDNKQSVASILGGLGSIEKK